jgi:hypothetical protein
MGPNKRSWGSEVRWVLGFLLGIISLLVVIPRFFVRGGVISEPFLLVLAIAAAIALFYRRFPEQIRPYLLPGVVALVVVAAVCVVFPVFLLRGNAILVVAALTIVLESLRGKPAKRNPPSTR